MANILDPARNFIVVSIFGGVSASATSIALVSGQGALLPDPSTEGAYNMSLWDGLAYAAPHNDPNVEIVRVTGISGDTLTITRGQEGTAAVAHNTSGGYKLTLGWTKKSRDDAEVALQDRLATANFKRHQALTGTVDGVNATFTIPDTIVTGSEVVTLNGVTQTPRTGGSPTSGYTISGSTVTMIGTSIPQTGDDFECEYIKL